MCSSDWCVWHNTCQLQGLLVETAQKSKQAKLHGSLAILLLLPQQLPAAFMCMPTPNPTCADILQC
jgi:hypothetical protein